MRRHPLRFLMGVLLLVGIGSYAVWIGAIGSALSFTSLAKDVNYPGGLPPKAPAIVVLSSLQDANALIDTVFRATPDALSSYPQFVHGLRGTDYQQFVVLLVLQGAEGPYAHVEIQRVTHIGNWVTVQASFTRSVGQSGPTVVNSPYHLIAVRKDGLRGPNIHFKLTNGWFVVAETTQAVP